MAAGEKPGRGRWRPTRPTRADDAGFGLIELCVTVAVVGIALIPLVGSIGTAARSSDLITTRSQAEGYARQLGELVRTQIPQKCSSATPAALRQEYKDALHIYLGTHELSNFDYSVTDVRVTSDPTATNPVDPLSAPWSNTCSTAPLLPPLEWVQITVTSNATPSLTSTIGALQRNASVP